MATERVGDLTLQEMRTLLREELKSLIHEAIQDTLVMEGIQLTAKQDQSFDPREIPVLDVGPWPEHFIEER